MKKVNTINWKKFRVGDLFYKLDLRFKKKSFDKTRDVSLVETPEFNLPLVNAKHFNNGIMYYGRECDFESADMTIDIVANGAASTGDVYPQPQKTGVLVDAYLIKPHNHNISTYMLYFLATVIQRCIKEKYSYDDKCVWNKVKEDYIYLPVKNGSPDWQYMEDYMRRIEQQTQTAISVFVSSKYAPRKIDTTYWKEYPLYSEYLFEVNMGSKLDRVKMTKFNPIINFVGRGSVNNGVVDCVDVIDGIKPYNVGCITLSLGGSVGASFIQEKPFYTSQNVCVLIPRNNLSILCKRFIVTMIQNEGQRKYKAFTDELNRHIRTDFRIKLPATPAGEPDWRYMEMYMRGVEAIAKEKISLLTKNKQEPVQGSTINNYGTVNIYEK